jgi:hypothetical protein
MFRKGSRFVQMFNKAIDENRYHIEMIKRKYLEHRPPSKCSMNKHGPIALCELFKLKFNHSTCCLAMTPYCGLLIVFFVGMSSACFVFSGELLKWTKFRK